MGIEIIAPVQRPIALTLAAQIEADHAPARPGERGRDIVPHPARLAAPRYQQDGRIIGFAADTYGEPDDPAVLLIPGSGQTRGMWHDVATALARSGRRVISLDLRGQGESDRPLDGRYDLDAHVGDLRSVLSRLEDRPVVVAASLGGWIASACLGEDGQHLATGLVLVDTALQPGPSKTLSVACHGGEAVEG